MDAVTVEELEWSEQPLGEVELPKERLQLAAGFGSGLATRSGQPSDLVWAIGDRGPNLKLKDARERYGWSPPPEWRDVEGAKLMPRPDIGPALAQLAVGDRSVEVRQVIRLTAGGKPVSGLPVPESGHAECEPALGLDGGHLEPDPSGMDTEGLALLEDGSFWAGEEYGPSLVRIASDGEVLLRLVPEGVELPGAPYPVHATLPALAAKRHLNRGFEAVAATPSGKWLYLAFQSPLAHPGPEQHKRGRHVRVWRLDSEGSVKAQFLYPLDEPASFARDNAAKRIGRDDIKLCEITALSEDTLLVLERASETSKIYRVRIDDALALGEEHLRVETRPTAEMLSCDGAPLPELDKELLFTSDERPEVGADIEGMALLDERTLLIVSDNDFGCEGKHTRFYRLRFAQALL
jgi:hypothetical protein